MSDPEWRDSLPSPPAGAQLVEAWMTTFDPPDAPLLVERLLPSLLGTAHDAGIDGPARPLFFAELGDRLNQLRGRITVISSPPRRQRPLQPYPWLWRYVSHFTVGANGAAVQHAKLWAFHWRAGSEDMIELHVSSTNLTESAFTEQLQAGWQARLALAKTGSADMRGGWGQLIDFFEALGASAGEEASKRIGRLIDLLWRAKCPKDVVFVASIPGRKGAARQLKAFKPTQIHILSPTIGEWDARRLAAWAGDIGVAMGNVRLKWIPEAHPWVNAGGWTLTEATRKSLEDHGVRLDCLASDQRLAKQHTEADQRWSHAKLYVLRRGAKQQLLVTSANWSTSAWGAGREAPRNFELGVVLPSSWDHVSELRGGFVTNHLRPHCVDRAEPEEHTSALSWAEATWNGKKILCEARSTSAAAVSVAVTFTGGGQRQARLASGKASLPWTDDQDPPLAACFQQGAEALQINVMDLRSASSFAKTPLPEVDPKDAQALREAFLLQRYGGPAVDQDASVSAARQRDGVGEPPPTANYAVQSLIDARAAFDVVDCWRDALKRSWPSREQVEQDGKELRALFESRGTAGDALAAEELCWRLARKSR